MSNLRAGSYKRSTSRVKNIDGIKYQQLQPGAKRLSRRYFSAGTLTMNSVFPGSELKVMLPPNWPTTIR